MGNITINLPAIEQDAQACLDELVRVLSEIKRKYLTRRLAEKVVPWRQRRALRL